MEKTKIAKLVLNAENCESFAIPMGKVTELRVDDVVSNISADQTGEIQRSWACRRFVLQVSRAFLHQLATEAFHEDGECMMLDERLSQMPDIVDVDLIDTDHHTVTFRLPWRDGEYGETNVAMTTSIDQDRDQLCLVVE